MKLKDLDLDLTVKGGKVTAKVNAPGIKLDLELDTLVTASDPMIGRDSPIWQQLSTVAMHLAQGLAQAGNINRKDEDDDDGGDGGDEDEAEPPARRDASPPTQ